MSADDVKPNQATEITAWLHYGETLGTVTDAVKIFDALRAEVERLRADLAARDAAGVPERVSWMALAGIGRKHFGNPIPQAWYDAARELLSDALRSAPSAGDVPLPTIRYDTETVGGPTRHPAQDVVTVPRHEWEALNAVEKRMRAIIADDECDTVEQTAYALIRLDAVRSATPTSVKQGDKT